MAIVTLDVTGRILHPDLTPATGSVTFQIPTDLNDVVANITYAPGTSKAILDGTGSFTITGLIATDSPDLAEAGTWLYRVHVLTDSYVESFSTSLPMAFSPVAEFADLIPAQVEPCTDDGSPCASIAQIAELQASIADLNSDLALKADKSIVLTAGIAMSGGGDLSANRTFDVDLGQTSTTVAEGRAPWFTYAPMPISGRFVYTSYGATATVTPVLDSARYTPFAVWQGFTATSIAIEVTTLQAASVVRLGLYADNGAGLPGARITDFGTVSAASLGVKTITPVGGIVFANRTIYWLCAVVQTAGGTAALRASNYHDSLILPSTNTVITAAISAYAQAGVSGALGSPAVPADAAGGPRFMLLVS